MHTGNYYKDQKKDFAFIANQYNKDQTHRLVQLWAEFVNSPKRGVKEIPFILAQLSSFKNPRIFDAALRSGSTSINLKNSGIQRVVSNEIDKQFIKLAKQQAVDEDVSLSITSYDWTSRAILNAGTFDGVLCLGNSLTYLFELPERQLAIKHFKSLLSENGKLLIDERNYAHHFTGKGEHFKFSGEFVYCGSDKISVRPYEITPDYVIIEYARKHNHLKGYLMLYPFKEGEMHALLKEAGFNHIEVFGNYQPKFRKQDPEFLTYVCSD